MGEDLVELSVTKNSLPLFVPLTHPSEFIFPDLASIVKLCPNLTHLDISDNPFLSHSAVEVTSTLRNLEELKNEQVAVDSDEDYDWEIGSWETDWHSDDSDSSINVPPGLLFFEGDFGNSSSDSF